ncbi:uncharacterized protein E0L32_002857 [Thyridium curvatum]|uniref:Xylanolytic transcriptional activator regulatory domain-containing protein n=1 Tax=Thyridium curvatum TaxID=1093900 RepID=A0A507BEL0_9PEZI|nr:uncharacterized protein E0L32_002857 [Thyridium curvatum]TPX17756.1 hypothetical protein E0L32_002857 [Thyridium curvatum]
MQHHQRPPELPQPPMSSRESTVPDFDRNPLVDNGETFAIDPNGKYWYMGPTSSWAFCRRVVAMIGSRVPEPEPPVDPWDLQTRQLTWVPLGLHQQPSVENLPSRDYALFLLMTVKFHLGPLSQIIHDDSFRQHLERFYRNPAAEASQSRYWYAQLLIILAYGEAFSANGTMKTIPGLDYASRALALTSSLIPMGGDTLAAAEALCLIALYLQALDLRLMAFQMIGQALRICLIEGWHRQMPADQVDVRHSQRCNTVFWTAYIIDREFGTLVGAPSSIRDEDITTKLPSALTSSVGADALALQIRLARLTATILTGVYGVDRSSSGSLLRDTQSALHDIADISRDMSVFLGSNLEGINIKTSKTATRLILSYHHCVVLTTRPLVMCLLQRRLARGGQDKPVPSDPISSLLQSCSSSALNILKMLKSLCDSNLIDCFLPFQLETVFSSTFLLYVIGMVAPDFVTDRSWLSMAHDMFDTMIARGSPAAPLRKREFQRLEQVMEAYLAEQPVETEREVPRQLYNSAQDQESIMGVGNSVGSMGDASYMSQIPWTVQDGIEGFIMSPTDILNMADELQIDDFIVHQ